MSRRFRSALFAGLMSLPIIGNAIPAMADETAPLAEPDHQNTSLVSEDWMHEDETLNDTVANAIDSNTAISDIPDNFVSTIVNFNSSLCLAIGSASAESGKAAIQWTCGSGGKSGNPEQKWRFFEKADGYQIVNGSSGLCLTIAGGKTDNAVPAVQLPCKGGLEQRWIFREDSLNIMNARTKKCLAIGSAKTDRGLGAIQWPCNSNPNGNPEQEWIISEESEFPSSESELEPTDELYQGLKILENVPDEIIANGDEAARIYLQDWYGLSMNQQGTVLTRGFFGCIGAIGSAAISIVSPIKKVKAAIKAAGGARKLYNVLSKTYKKARSQGISRKESINRARNAAVKRVNRIDYKEILFSLTGFGAVIGECFE